MKRRPLLIDRKLRAQVYERDGGCCASCGQPVSRDRFECHHRKLRSRGGQDSVCNLVTLDFICHASLHCTPRIAERFGLILPSHADPATSPVRHRAGWVLLRPDGSLVATCDPVEVAS